MSTIEKLIAKMQQQPHGIRMAEAHKALLFAGYELARQKGSHCHYINKHGDVITIKEDNPLKAVYVRDILSRIAKG